MTTRREFIKKSGALAAVGMMTNWASAKTESDKWGSLLPKRQLIRNGETVTSYCMGGYHLGSPDQPKEAERQVERAMELGVRFFDNARGYHRGRSEEYMGQFLTPKYRKEVFLMTKAPARTGDEVRAQLDDSLKALKTDYVDLWQIHSINSPEDVDNRIRDGVLDAFLEAKASGKARYIGFTGHRNPATHLHFLARLDEMGIELDACQMPLNVCDASFESFQHEVMPRLLEKKYGIIAMKTMAGGSMMGGRIDTTPNSIKTESIPNVINSTSLTLANLHQYVYSLPISSLCSGTLSIGQLEENVKVLTELKSLSSGDRYTLETLAEPFSGLNVENYKRVLAG